MSLNPIFIKETTLSSAWFHTLYKCIEHGREFIIDQGSFKGQKRLEFDHVTIQITQPWVEPLLPKVNPQLGFPDPVEEGYLDSYLPYLMTGEEKEDEAYTYGQRICAANITDEYAFTDNQFITYGVFGEWWHDGLDIFSMGEDTLFNQLNALIYSYKEYGHRNNQMILQVGQPSDMILADPPCVLGSASIITSNGFKRADEISIGDYVLTHKGRFRKVTKTYSRKYSGPMHYIKNSCESGTTLTNNHPLATYQIDKCYCQKMVCKPDCKKQYSSYKKHGKNCKASYQNYAVDWKNIDQINHEQNWLLFPDLTNLQSECKYSHKELWLFGRFIADGDYNKKDGIRFNIGSSKQPCVEKIKKYAEAAYNHKHPYIDTSGINTIRISFYSRELFKKYHDLFGKHAPHKKIPFEFLFFPNDKLIAFIDGMVSGDGYVRRQGKSISYSTSSICVKNMFVLILRKLGFTPTVSSNSIKDSKINGRKIKANHINYIIYWSNNVQKNKGGWFDNDYHVQKAKKVIHDISISDGNIVYNYEVDEDNSYIADDIVVHNCLRHIDTRIQDNKLHFFPYFRSWDLFSGFPANLAAIELMKQYCAAEIGVENGEIIASSKGLHIYDYVWEISEAIRGRKIEEFK